MRQLKINKSITNRGESLDKYFHEIGKYDLISIDEEVELAARVRQKDQSAIDRLTKANLRFVVSVAKQYQKQGLSLADLINEGNLGLIRAVEKFDETRGFKFISYAVWWIRQSIIQAINEQSRIVRLPLNQLTSISQYQKETNQFEQKYERLPTADEMTALMGIDDEKLKEIQRGLSKHVSYDAPMDSEDRDSSAMVNMLENKSVPTTDNQLMQESFSFEIERLLNSVLTEKEQIVLRQSLGIGTHEHSIDEISESIGLSRERVRQIKEKALSKMRESSQCDILRTYLD